MLQGSELALDRAQIERSTNRKSAILAKGRLKGYNFIRLSLKNIRKRKISGIEILQATEFTNNDLGGVTDYHLELTGGTIDFEWYPELGMYIFDMVDTDRNREFLATHYEYHFWDILDQKVELDVQLRLEFIKKALLAKPKVDPRSGPAGFWEEVRANEAKQLAAVRGETPIDTSVPLQPVSDNTPDVPGYIEGQEKAKTPFSLKQKEPEVAKALLDTLPDKRGPGTYKGIKMADRIKMAKLRREREQQPPVGENHSVGVGVTQP